MQVTGAVIREQSTTFAVVVVQSHVINNSHQANGAVAALTPAFGQIPIILMAQDRRGRPTYYGRRDIAQFMSRVPLRAIPCKQYTIN